MRKRLLNEDAPNGDAAAATDLPSSVDDSSAQLSSPSVSEPNVYESASDSLALTGSEEDGEGDTERRSLVSSSSVQLEQDREYSPSPSPEELHGAVVVDSASSSDLPIVERTPVQDEELPVAPSYDEFSDSLLVPTTPITDDSTSSSSANIESTPTSTTV